MRQAVMSEPGRIEYNDAPVPSPGPGEVLLRIKKIGVCGSDVHVWHGQHPFTPYPVVQGHEFCGMIEAIGPEVKRAQPGMKATAAPQIVCGKCNPCKRGDYHICDALKVRGFQAPGCAQDYFVVPDERLVLLPESLSYDEGAFIEPAAVAAHATRRAGSLNGKNVVVLGAGPIGNLVAQAARCRGAQKVLITDLSDFRLKKALDVGVEATCNVGSENFATRAKETFGTQGFEVAFEAAGVEASLDTAIQQIQKGGTIIIVGVYGKRPQVDMSVLGDRELSLIGSLMYQQPDYEQAVDWIAKGDMQVKPLITHHFAFEDYAMAYQLIDKEPDKTLKVMVDLD